MVVVRARSKVLQRKVAPGAGSVGPSERPIAHPFLATGKIELQMLIFDLTFIGKNENFKQLILSVILGCFKKVIFNEKIQVKNVQLERF